MDESFPALKTEDGTLMITEKEIGALLSLVKEYVEPAFEGQSDQIQRAMDGIRADFEAQIKSLPIPENGKDGSDGKDADIDFIKTQIFLEVAKLPLAKDGKDGIDGKDGKDADPEYIKSVIAEEVSKVPAAKDGKDADIEQVKALIVEEV